MEPIYIALAAFGLFIAGVVKGASGLGYSSCALPFLAAAFGLKTAIVLVVIPAMVSNFALLWTAGHFQETLARFWRFYLASLPGIVVGLAALAWLDARIAEVALGALISAYVIYSLVRPAIIMPPGLEKPVQLPAGLLNGFFTGLTGSQVMPLLPLMLSLQLDSARMVQAVNIAVTTASGFMAIALLAGGMMSLPGLGGSIAAVIPAMAGIYLGVKLRSLIPDASFKRLVLMILGCIGVALMMRA